MWDFYHWGHTLRTHPVASVTSLDIFIFLVVPLYRSSKLQGSARSIGAAFRGALPDAPSPAAFLNEVKISSPNIPLLKLGPPARPPISPIPPYGVENPKNSENISSALRGLNRNDPWPPPSEGPENPPAPGGGTCPFNPSSPYWSYTTLFCGSLKTCNKHSKNFRINYKTCGKWK